MHLMWYPLSQLSHRSISRSLCGELHFSHFLSDGQTLLALSAFFVGMEVSLDGESVRDRTDSDGADSEGGGSPLSRFDRLVMFDTASAASIFCLSSFAVLSCLPFHCSFIKPSSLSGVMDS